MQMAWLTGWLEISNIWIKPIDKVALLIKPIDRVALLDGFERDIQDVGSTWIYS